MQKISWMEYGTMIAVVTVVYYIIVLWRFSNKKDRRRENSAMDVVRE